MLVCDSLLDFWNGFCLKMIKNKIGICQKGKNATFICIFWSCNTYLVPKPGMMSQDLSWIYLTKNYKRCPHNVSQILETLSVAQVHIKF